MSTKRHCKRCDAELDDLAVLCVRCGANALTGEQHQSQIDEPVEEPPPIGRLEYAVRFIPALFPGLTHPGVLLLSVVCLLFSATAIFFGMLIALAFMAFYEGMIMTGFGVVVYAQVVAWLLTGELRILPDCMMDFESIHWNVFFLLIALPLFSFYLLIQSGLFDGWV